VLDRHDTILVLNGLFTGNELKSIPRVSLEQLRMGPADDPGNDFKILKRSQRLFEAIFDRTPVDGYSGISRVSKKPIAGMFSGTANLSPK
jgi:hypothetical protein